MISIFKTSVKRKSEIKLLKPHLDELLCKSRWNFDLEDSDNILRIESENCSERKVVELLEGLNFKCVELE
ncbi:hypothetical protein FF125_02555 [Aureibaculum algae]|uniref:Uncharacterized protein n=1 Tax=Aureibaculum algae TaxID=2584122 RepID=A0A5B7TL59_9FLAO|nr:hypothetical protein [Aureibaculum algae]QCX37369.1 hypothetical protein FF125_02555 [Aureibaculum algae]